MKRRKYEKEGSILGEDRTERATSTAYKTVYISSGTSQSNSYNLLAEKGTIKKGDAIYETSSTYSDVTSSWFGADADFPNTHNPFFSRSGSYSYSYAGMLYFRSHNGNDSPDGSFRLVLTF